MKDRDLPSEILPNGIVLAVEWMKECLDETRVLHADHWRETEGYRDAQGYAPDYEQYRQLEEAGAFVYFTLRRDGRLVGHLGYVLHKSRHTSKKNSVEDFFYIVPGARGAGAGKALLRYAVRILKACGCKQAGMSSKVTHPIDSLLKEVGFNCVATFWVMNLEEETA